MSGSVAKNTLYLTVASIGQKLLAFAYFLAVARILGPEMTGEYFIALSVITLAQVAADLGVANVVIRSVAQKPDEALNAVRRAMAVKIPATVIAVICAVAITKLLGHEPAVQWLVYLALPILIADSFSLFFYAVLRGTQKLSYESLGLLIGQGMTMVIGGAALFLTGSPNFLVMALFVGSLFNAVFSGYRVSRVLGVAALSPHWDASATRRLLRDALPFFLAAVFVKIYSSLDIQFLYAYLGAAVVGVYSVAYKFTYAFQFIPLAFSAALYPALSAALVRHDADSLAKSLSQAFRYMLLVGSPLAFGLSAIAEQAVRVTGDDYANAAPVLAVMAFAIIPSFLDIPVGSLLNAGGRQALKTACFGATVVLNAALNWLLIPRFGMMGAAYASVISLSVLFVCGFVFVPTVARAYRRAEILRSATPILISGFVMFMAVRALLPYLSELGMTLALAFSLLAGSCTYAAALWLTGGVKASDLRHVLSLIRRKPSYATTPPPHA